MTADLNLRCADAHIRASAQRFLCSSTPLYKHIQELGNQLFSIAICRKIMYNVNDKFLYAELEKLLAKGYRPCGGEVRFVVAWKGENDKEETAVLLPDLHFKKE